MSAPLRMPKLSDSMAEATIVSWLEAPAEADGVLGEILVSAGDHRAVYGADAARFLGRVGQLLEHPLSLLMDRPEEVTR